MSSDTPPINPSVKMKEKSPLDPIAEFQQLKLETEETDKKIMKSSPFPTTAETSNEMLGIVLNELKEMRMEMKEMKLDVKENKQKLEEIGENQKKLQEEVRNVQNDVTGIKKNQEEVQKNQQNQEQHLQELKVNVSSILNEIKKEPESYSETDIRRQINGKWRNVDDHEACFSLKYEGDTFMKKWSHQDSFDQYTLGIETLHWTTSVEKNKIVQRTWSLGEYGKDEYFIHEENLIYVRLIDRMQYSISTFERIGVPDPQ